MNDKKKFLHAVFFSNAIQGAFQRIKIYPNTLSQVGREEFRKELRSQLDTLALEYVDKEVLSEDHTKNIECLATGSGLTFGVSQKLLNLYLKYLWCAGEIKTPPHCPIDSKILAEVKLSNIRWSKMNRSEYEFVISSISNKFLVGNMKTLAEWELGMFNRLNYAQTAVVAG